MLIIVVNPSRHTISNKLLGSPPSNVALVEQIYTQTLENNCINFVFQCMAKEKQLKEDTTNILD